MNGRRNELTPITDSAWWIQNHRRRIVVIFNRAALGAFELRVWIVIKFAGAVTTLLTVGGDANPFGGRRRPLGVMWCIHWRQQWFAIVAFFVRVAAVRHGCLYQWILGPVIRCCTITGARYGIPIRQIHILLSTGALSIQTFESVVIARCLIDRINGFEDFDDYRLFSSPAVVTPPRLMLSLHNHMAFYGRIPIDIPPAQLLSYGWVRLQAHTVHRAIPLRINHALQHNFRSPITIGNIAHSLIFHCSRSASIHSGLLLVVYSTSRRCHITRTHWLLPSFCCRTLTLSTVLRLQHTLALIIRVAIGGGRHNLRVNHAEHQAQCNRNQQLGERQHQLRLVLLSVIFVPGCIHCTCYRTAMQLLIHIANVDWPNQHLQAIQKEQKWENSPWGLMHPPFGVNGQEQKPQNGQPDDG